MRPSGGAPEAELERDVTRLKEQWDEIEKKVNNSSTAAPSQLYGEPGSNSENLF